MSFTTHKQKKKPPPRPPPPNISKLKSKSTLNLVQSNNSANLIQWSPPSSPKTDRPSHFGGSVSSSFSSSTSSLASSKKSFEFESPVGSNVWPVQTQNTIQPPQSNGVGTFQSYLVAGSGEANTTANGTSNSLNVPSIFGPTIIRAKVKPNTRTDNVSPKSDSPPMPNIPPPSPPKVDIDDIETPFGIALFDYPASDPSDLNLQVGDIVVLVRRINNDWLYGKVIDKEGMFPESFIDIQVPLKEDENLVTALYDFPAQMSGDLSLKAGQKIKVLRKISDDWLYGECNGLRGQFPCNFVNRVPTNI